MTRSMLMLAACSFAVSACMQTDGADAPAAVEVAAAGTQDAGNSAQRPARELSCQRPGGNVTGWFDEPDENGRYYAYCFEFRPDGTFTYSDSDDTVEGTWSKGENTIAWEPTENYGFVHSAADVVPQPISGTISGVVYEAASR